MAPRRFVHGNTAETARGGFDGGENIYPLHGIHFRLWLLLSVTRWRRRSSVRPALVCLLHNPDSICLLLARSLVADRLKPASR